MLEGVGIDQVRGVEGRAEVAAAAKDAHGHVLERDVIRGGLHRTDVALRGEVLLKDLVAVGAMWKSGRAAVVTFCWNLGK